MKKNIIVVRNDQIGDSCLSSPLFQHIKITWPESNLIVISSKQAIGFIQLLTSVDKVIVDFKQQSNKKYSIRDLKNFLISFKPDMIFFAKMDSDYIIASALAKIKIRVGDKNNLLLNSFLTHKINISWHDFTKHEIDQQLRLLSPFVSELQVPKIVFKENKQIQKKLFQTFFNKKNYIVIHPSYGTGNRSLVPAQYKLLIESIISKGSYDVVITGVEKDKQLVDSFNLKQDIGLINLVGKISIQELYYVIKFASVVISAETGPMHLSSILKKKIINISPTKYVRPFRWGPYYSPHVIIKNNVSCKLVCNTYKKQCLEMDCIESIKVDDILKSINFLSNNTKFPENRLQYWIKIGATVNIVINKISDSQIRDIKTFIKNMKKNSVNFNLIITSKKIKHDFDSEEVHLISLFNIKQWVSFLSRQQTPIVHLYGVKNKLWKFCIKKLVALQTNIEPFLVSSINLNQPLTKVFNDYIYQLNLLSK